MEAEGRSWDFWEGGACRVSCALRALATLSFCAAAQVFGAPEGSVSPVGCWARGPKRPGGAPKGSVCPVGTWARGPKRPEGVSKYKGCARPAHRTPIFARERNERWVRPAPSATIERPGTAPNPGRRAGKRVPCGHLGRRPKATRSGAAKPCARRRGASARWAVARSAKRPEGVSKYKGCARQRTERRYLRGSETMRAPQGSVSPVGCCAKRKAT